MIRFRFSISLGLILALIAVVIYDSRQHFDAKLVVLKKKHNSGQRNWNLFFGQKHVYYSSSVRYTSELKELQNIIEHNVSIFSDLATSYYMAASLPIYVKNVHRHHGIYLDKNWEALIWSRKTCSIDWPEHYSYFNGFLQSQQNKPSKKEIPTVRYLVLNVDRLNDNLYRDCLAKRAPVLLEHVENLAELVYQGEFLNVYMLTPSAIN